VQKAAIWETWDEPDRQVAVVHWGERDIAVVFPLLWAAEHSLRAMVARAKERIAEVEGKADRMLVPGSILLAFSAHEERAPGETLAPDVLRNLLPMTGV